MAVVAGLELEEEEICSMQWRLGGMVVAGGNGRGWTQKALSWIILHFLGVLGVVLF